MIDLSKLIHISYLLSFLFDKKITANTANRPSREETRLEMEDMENKFCWFKSL